MCQRPITRKYEIALEKPRKVNEFYAFITEYVEESNA